MQNAAATTFSNGIPVASVYLPAQHMQVGGTPPSACAAAPPAHLLAATLREHLA